MQPTASSAPAPRRSTATAPAECERSQISVAPRERAAAVSAGHVGQRARAVGDVREHDDVALGEAAEVRGHGPSSSSLSKIRSSSPRAAAIPSST